MKRVLCHRLAALFVVDRLKSEVITSGITHYQHVAVLQARRHILKRIINRHKVKKPDERKVCPPYLLQMATQWSCQFAFYIVVLACTLDALHVTQAWLIWTLLPDAHICLAMLMLFSDLHSNCLLLGFAASSLQAAVETALRSVSPARVLFRVWAELAALLLKNRASIAVNYTNQRHRMSITHDLW